MTWRAMDLRCCETHGENSLFHYGVCYRCAEAVRPKQITDSKAVQKLSNLRRHRAKVRMAKARAGKRTAAVERAEREARNSLAVV